MAAMPRAFEMLGELCGTAWPPTASVPESAVTAPVMILISVDLPAPFSPIRAWTSPARSSKETPFSAHNPEYDLVMQVASKSGLRGMFLSIVIVAKLLSAGLVCLSPNAPELGSHRPIATSEYNAEQGPNRSPSAAR